MGLQVPGVRLLKRESGELQAKKGSAMTPKQINAKIAETIGWKRPSIPNFHGSLDACRIFEDSLNKGNIKDPDHLRYRYSHILYSLIVPSDIQPCLAPAEYRAMAFLVMAKSLTKEQLAEFQVKGRKAKPGKGTT